MLTLLKITKSQGNKLSQERITEIIEHKIRFTDIRGKTT
jgi:hypothetical protein